MLWEWMNGGMQYSIHFTVSFAQKKQTHHLLTHHVLRFILLLACFHTHLLFSGELLPFPRNS